MQESLHEYADSRGVAVRVDRAAGVIRGVKILGLQSRNGRVYLPEALAQAAALYEGAKVNVNHPKGGPTAPRDYQDRIGVIRGVAVQPDGLYADFHFNPKHALAEQLAWDAEHAPENVVFSHNVEARTARTGNQVTVEAILQVQSVDLVADPATTRGLFEAADRRVSVLACPDSAGTSGDACPTGPEQWTIEDFRARRPDLVEAVLEEQAGELARLRAEIDRLESLRGDPARPQSRDQHRFYLDSPPDARSFAEAIRKG